jgi:Flp pilus assembly protein TadD
MKLLGARMLEHERSLKAGAWTCYAKLRRYGVVALVLLALTACSTTKPIDATAARPTAAEAQEAILAAAEADVEARRFQLAYQRLARLNAEAAVTARAQYAIAEVLLGLDRPKEALARFEEAQREDAWRVRAWQGMGLSLLAMGNTNAAISQLNSALEADPSLWRSWAALGRAYDNERRWGESAAAYEKCLALSPHPAVIANNIGMSLLVQKRYAEAAHQFEKAMAEDPALETARSNLRIALAWQGRYNESLAGLALSGRADALNNVGYVAMLRGDYREAQQYFSQALESSPTYHGGAAMNLEALRLLVKSKNNAQVPNQAAPQAAASSQR